MAARRRETDLPPAARAFLATGVVLLSKDTVRERVAVGGSNECTICYDNFTAPV
jgi:hypothetical protein